MSKAEKVLSAEDKRMLAYGVGNQSREPMCHICEHYVVHYVYSDYLRRYEPIQVGHCTYPLIKARKAYDLCDCFKLREEQKG